jgi:hypothetical protein
MSAAEGIASDGPQSPYPKKKGKLSYNEFYKFREELDAKIKTSDDQLGTIENDAKQAKLMIEKYIPQINTITTDLNESKTNIYKL